MDYNSLTAQILSYSNRNEPAFVAQVPNLINQAMSRIYSDVKSTGFQLVNFGNMVAGSSIIQKPQNFKECESFQITIPGTAPFSIFLLERSYEFCVTYAPNPLLHAVPVFYSSDLEVPPNNVALSNFYIAPTPDLNYAYRLTYSTFPPLFNAQNPQNFLTDKYPNLLVYACMVEVIPFLKSDERIPPFESLYNRAVQAINKDSKGLYTDRTTRRDKD